MNELAFLFRMACATDLLHLSPYSKKCLLHFAMAAFTLRKHNSRRRVRRDTSSASQTVEAEVFPAELSEKYDRCSRSISARITTSCNRDSFSFHCQLGRIFSPIVREIETGAWSDNVMVAMSDFVHLGSRLCLIRKKSILVYECWAVEQKV